MKVKISVYSTQEEFENKINEIGIKNITKINISCNLNITIIPYFPNLKILCCGWTIYTTIPFMEKLEELYCWSCHNLTEIPLFPNLKLLECSWTNISFIPFMENLEKLSCSGCLNIIKIPYFYNLKELYCERCPNLLEIPNFPNLKKLWCDCTLKIKFYNKDLEIRPKINTLQYFQGRLFQNTYRTYELLIF